MKIIVCTLCINDWYYDVVRYAIRNLTNYCNTHNYNLIVDYGKGSDTIYDGKREPAWYKLLLIKKIMLEQDFDYLFWYDIDSQIIRHDIKLEYFIEKHFTDSIIDLVLPQDRTTFNTGTMFMRKSNFIIELMIQTWENPNEFDRNFWDQTSMEELYKRDESIQSKIKILPFGPIKNELVIGWTHFDPEKTFIIHCARCSHNKLDFYFMMDLFYIFKLDEENEHEYKLRIDWIKNKAVKYIEDICNGIDSPRPYSRRVKNIFNVE